MKHICRLGGFAVPVALGIVINYFALVPYNPRSIGFWCLIGFTFLAIAVIEFLVESYFDESFLATWVNSIITCICIIVLLIGGLTSAKIFNIDKYQSLVEIQDGNFEKDISSVDDVNDIAIVDMQTAQSLGDRTIGSIKNSTWYEVDDEYNLIKYQGEQYRISPLNYGGYWKSQKAKTDGIPGYVIVNTSTQEAKFIKLDEGIKYSPSAYWSFDLKRHLHKQYPTTILGTSFFEIDEDGNPYWITVIKTPTIGLFGGEKENNFIITNAISGASEKYATKDLPEWVDHAYDLNYLINVSEYNLTLVNGYWNSLFSKTGILNTSYSYYQSNDNKEETSNNYEGYNTAITAKDEIVFYTGLTPANNAESNVGFLLMNPRTGEVKKYDCAGAEESSAQASAESLVQDLRYTSTFPTVINVDGNETYLMFLKDKAGLVQRYALCNIKNYTKVVQAETLEEALKLYKEKLGVIPNTDKTENTEETLEAEGKINNLYQVQVEGTTYYYFTIDDKSDLYMSSIKNSNKQVFLKEGTSIAIKYQKTSEEGVFIVKEIKF